MSIKDFVVENGVIISYKGSDKKVEIPGEVDRIGKGAFKNNRKIEEVIFQGVNLKSIDENAFNGCSNLKGIKLPEGLVQIGDHAFRGCDKMEYIYIPAHVMIIGEYIVESQVPVFGISGSEAEKYAKSVHLAFKTDFNKGIHAFKKADIVKNRVETKTFDIFGEKITVSNSLARYHDIMEYYAGQKEPLYKTMLSYIYDMGDKSKVNDPSQALNELKKTAVKRLEKDGIFIAETRFMYILEPMNAIVEVYKAASNAYIELANGVSADIEAKAEMLYSQAESQVTGLSYGYIGDSFGLAVYGIDDYLTRRKQRRKAYAYADSQMNEFKEQHTSKALKVYRDFCDKIAPFLNIGVSAYVDAICKTEIENYVSKKMIDADIVGAYDVEKSDELVDGLYERSSPNAEFVIALALKKYPMNMVAHIYAVEKEFTCNGLEELRSFLDLNNKLQPHKDRVKKDKFERVSTKVLGCTNVTYGIKVIEDNSFLSKDEIKTILTRYSAVLTKSVKKTVDNNPPENISLKEYCKQELKKIIDEVSWAFFDEYGVSPIKSSDIPEDAQSSFEKLVDYLETAIVAKQDEREVQLKSAEEALNIAKTRQDLENIISSLEKINGYKNSKELCDIARKKKLALENEFLGEMKEKISAAKTAEDLNIVEREINSNVSSKEVTDVLSTKRNEIKKKEKKLKLIKILSVVGAIIAFIVFIAIYSNTAHYRAFKDMTQTGYFDFDKKLLDIEIEYNDSFNKWAKKTLAKKLKEHQENDDIKSAIHLLYNSSTQENYLFSKSDNLLRLKAEKSFIEWLIVGSVENGNFMSETEYAVEYTSDDYFEIYYVSWNKEVGYFSITTHPTSKYEEEKVVTINTVNGEVVVGENIDYSERMENAEQKIKQDKIVAEKAAIDAEKNAVEAEKAEKKAEVAKKKDNYEKGVQCLEKGKKAEAAIAFGKAGDYLDAREKSFKIWDEIAVRETISAGNIHTVALREDGKTVATGANNDNQCDVEGKEGVVAVGAFGNTSAILSADRGIYIYNSDYEWYQFGNVEDVVAISVGNYHVACLKPDGTVVIVDQDDDDWEEAESWTDIVAISSGDGHVVGLKLDGTVVAAGDNGNGQCNVSGWKDIIAVSAGYGHTVALKSDGTVVAVGDNENGQCGVSGWKGIVAISSGTDHTVALKSDGTVVATKYIEGEYNNNHGQCNVSGWKDIVAVSAGYGHTVALKSDGTVVATRYIETGDKSDGQCDVLQWENIKTP